MAKRNYLKQAVFPTGVNRCEQCVFTYPSCKSERPSSCIDGDAIFVFVLDVVSDKKPKEAGIFMPSSGSDFSSFYTNNCEECNKEVRCKHIKAFFAEDKPFEVNSEGKCKHRKPWGAQNKRSNPPEQLELF